MTKRTIILFAALLFGGAVKVSAGGEGGGEAGSDISVCYCAGRVNTIPVRTYWGTMTDAMKNPFEISILSGFESENLKLVASLLPQTTIDYVTLKTADVNVDYMSYVLLNKDGQLIVQEPLNKKVTTILMPGLADGTYLLKVVRDKWVMKTFRIIKKG